MRNWTTRMAAIIAISSSVMLGGTAARGTAQQAKVLSSHAEASSPAPTP